RKTGASSNRSPLPPRASGLAPARIVYEWITTPRGRDSDPDGGGRSPRAGSMAGAVRARAQGIAAAQAASSSRRVRTMAIDYPHSRSSGEQAFQDGVPGGTIRSFESLGSLSVVGDRLPCCVPAELASQPERRVRQVASRGDLMAALEVRNRHA